MKYKTPTMIIGIFVALGEASPTIALQTYPLVDHQKTEVIISKSELNRIAVFGDRIQQVFGAEGTFNVQTDDEGGQIFLKLNGGFSDTKPITLTLITEQGLTQDLKLIPREIDSQSVLFKPSTEASQVKPLSTPRQVEKAEPSPLEDIFTLMKAMTRNEELSGFKKLACEEQDSLQPDENLQQDCITIYQGESLEGRRYTLMNQGETPIHLKEEDFALPEDLAISFPKIIIHPQEKITFYKISRRAL